MRPCPQGHKITKCDDVGDWVLWGWTQGCMDRLGSFDRPKDALRHVANQWAREWDRMMYAGTKIAEKNA